MQVDIDGELIELSVLREAHSIEISCQGQTCRFELPSAQHESEADTGTVGHPQAPMSGAVVAVPVIPGDKVAAGDVLMVVEAMKMEHAIVAQASATVERSVVCCW